jgi:hypothetical protein
MRMNGKTLYPPRMEGVLEITVRMEGVLEITVWWVAEARFGYGNLNNVPPRRDRQFEECYNDGLVGRKVRSCLELTTIAPQSL